MKPDYFLAGCILKKCGKERVNNNGNSGPYEPRTNTHGKAHMLEIGFIDRTKMIEAFFKHGAIVS